MKLNEILFTKFPDKDFMKDIILQDDGNGIYIKEWNIPDVPEPDQKTLDEWEIEVQDEFNLKEKQRLRKEEYLKEGVTIEALIVAIWEAEAENRPDALNALQAKRLAIKDRIK